jgi:hypothetical protein
MSNHDYDSYRLVRQLVRDKSKTTKEIAEITGYNRTYVSQLRAEIPRIDEQRKLRVLERHSPDLLYALEDLLAVVAAHDGPKSVDELGVIGRAMRAVKKAKGEE